jgi:hypothetical protein
VRDVAALNAANSKAARPGHADDARPNNDSRLTCANSSSTRSTTASRSARCYVTLASNQVWGLAKTDREWAEKLTQFGGWNRSPGEAGL